MNQWYQCGTVACSIGWAAADPWFTRRRFSLYKGATVLPRFFSKRTEFISWHAVQEFFELSAGAAQGLFLEGAYEQPTKRNVINRIKKFVENREITFN